MFQTVINPFNMSQEALLEYAMNPDKQDIKYEGNLNKYPVLGTNYEAYDPFKEIVEESIDGNKGASVADFFDEQKYHRPQFQEQTPDEVLIGMNVREQADEFRRKKETLNSINALFNPIGGNTPEERAKSQTINQLLAEIDNFAIQYRLSKQQIETLKTQVLSNHLGEYITAKNALVRNDEQRAEGEAMAIAKGENPPDGIIVKDPVVGADELGIRNDAGKDDGDNGGNAAAGGGGAGGDLDEAVVRDMNQGEEETARRLLERLEALDKSTSGTVFAVIEARRGVKGWQKAFRLYQTLPRDRTKADEKYYNENGLAEVMPILADLLGYGSEMTDFEETYFANVLLRVKVLIK